MYKRQVQVLTNNRRIDPVEFENTMLMHLRGDAMDRLREEYNQIVRERTEWSNNIFREKYVEMCIRDRYSASLLALLLCVTLLASTAFAAEIGRAHV